MTAGLSETGGQRSSQPQSIPAPPASGQAAAPLPIGASVRLIAPVPYLKTADPMPMLRPPELIDPAEVGLVVECRALGMLGVRFRRGTFLLPAEVLSEQPRQDPG